MAANLDTTTTDYEHPTDIYWAVVRNQTDRHGYIELEHRGGKRWGVVLGDDEFTVQSDSPEFLDVLYAALTKLRERQS